MYITIKLDWKQSNYLKIFIFHENKSYLVDPASSDTLPSKIKPCMSQYSLDKVKPQTAH